MLPCESDLCSGDTCFIFVHWVQKISLTHLPYFRCDALMMEAVQTSETLVNSYQSTRHYNSKDSHFLLRFSGSIII
jgi:hypothetical protein